MTTALGVPADSHTSLERVVSYLQGEHPQRVACFPLILNPAARVLGVPIGVYNRDADVMGRAPVAAFGRYGNDLITIFSTTSTIAEAMGTKMKFFEDDAPQIDVPLLGESWDALADLKPVDPEKDGRLPIYLKATEHCVAEVGGEVVVSTIFAGPLTTAAALRPLDILSRELYKDKDRVNELLDICTESAIRMVDATLARKSLPIIVEPIGSGSLVSPKHFTEFVAPRLRKIADHIHEVGGGMPAVLHICGKTKPNWDAMLEADFDIWSLDAVHLWEAKEAAGHRVTFVGNVVPAHLLNNTPEQIDAEAKEICENMLDAPRGFILGSGCEVPNNTPPENIDALIAAARKYGRYDGHNVG
ncbi:MAG TPA: uroporphyrinogen decarboxylase family protein [Coriobacteriia bacterium]|nr:uroporphyrinogen decarboxylase family protein [Coriobacteriia bacterium]